MKLDGLPVEGFDDDPSEWVTGYWCPLDPKVECPHWGGPCMVSMGRDCPEVRDARREA